MDYVDSTILIYYFDHVGLFQARASRWIASLLAAGDILAVSDLVRMECRVLPLRSGNLVSMAAFDRFFSNPITKTVPVTTAGFDRAAQIRASYGFKAPDAIHSRRHRIGL